MSKELKSSANTGAKEKGIYDLSVLSQNERINLLGEIIDDVGDTNNDLYLRLLVFVNPLFTLKELDYFIELLQNRFDYCNVRIAEGRTFTGYYLYVLNLCESSLSKLSSLIAPQSEQEQSDVTDTEPQEQEEEPQEQEREVKKTSANNTGAEEKGIYDLQSRARYEIIEVHSVEIDNFKFDNRDVVAFCQTIEEAERLVKALSALNEDKPHYRYEYELIAPYNSIFDEHFDIQNIPGVLDDTLPF